MHSCVGWAAEEQESIGSVVTSVTEKKVVIAALTVEFCASISKHVVAACYGCIEKKQRASTTELLLIVLG